MPSRRIDLHTHSTASDGTTPPDVLVREAREAGLDVLALTDHDTVGGWDAAAAARPEGLTLVRGAELSCRSGGISLHLLAYLFDPGEPELAQRMAELRDTRVGRAERMVQLLAADGHPVTWEQVSALAGGAVGRPHVAQALLAHGLVDSVAEAFTPEWIGTRGRYWVPKPELDALDAVRLVDAAGGVTVFAHPAARTRGRTVADEEIEELAAAGLAGLEVDHVDHDDYDRARLRALAGRLGLLVTGSSDFHGEVKAVGLGEWLTDEAQLEVLVGRARGCPVLG